MLKILGNCFSIIVMLWLTKLPTAPHLLLLVVVLLGTNLTISTNHLLYFLRVFYLVSILICFLGLLGSLVLGKNPPSFLINTPVFFSLSGFYFEPLSFFFDKISLIFTITTLLIGFFALGFITFYLSDDKNILFFIKLINVFILSMVFLVQTDSILVIVLCWEFLGISSFFLIGYYHNKPYVMKSSLKAFCFNRVSDVFLFFFLVLFIYEYGTFSVAFVRPTGSLNEFLLLFSLLQLSFVKSAQGLYYFWLPDSMEAPIPASALIHSATLVSAGIYLCLRFRCLLLSNLFIREFLLWHSLLGSVVFSFIAFQQYDVKRLLAFSTIANCGFMYFLLALGFLNEVLFYFVVHGLLKSLLFLMAGFFIINNNHYQDIRDWYISRGDLVYTSMLVLFFVSLGCLGFTLSFEIKHTITFIYGEGYRFYLLLFFFYTYSINSMLYGLKFILTKFLNLTGSKCFYKTQINGEFTSVNLFATITVVCLFLFFISYNIMGFTFYNLSESSLTSLCCFILPLTCFTFLHNNKSFVILLPYCIFCVIFLC